VIDVELERDDHSSIPATAIERGLNHLMSELTPNQIRRSSRPDTGGENQKIIFSKKLFEY
jgi:hypothetical protein